MERFVWKRHKDIFKGIGIYHITFVVGVTIKEIARGMRQGWRQIMPTPVNIDPQMSSAGEYKQMPEANEIIKILCP